MAPATSAPRDDIAAVAALLGRRPQGPFQVVVRGRCGEPVVIANWPFLDDGTPMPTRFWLVDRDLCRRVSRLEGTGGVRQAEADVDPDLLRDAHERYQAARDALIPTDHAGPRPSGGVGGTARGVKCLHAHLAHHLAGGDDPVGRWVAERLDDEASAAAGGEASAGGAGGEASAGGAGGEASAGGAGGEAL